jgi:RimJ/RimL family protein N-acetyltransferase
MRVRAEDRDAVRGFLDEDPVGNAFVWDRAFQMAPDARVFVDGVPPRAVLSVARPPWAHGDHGVGLRATDPQAARSVVDGLPSGPAFCHLAEEWTLPFVREKARKIDAWPAWLFQLDPADFVDAQAHDTQPLTPDWAPRIAQAWSPDWPAEDLIRSRILGGPSFAAYQAGEPVAWAMTHFETDRVSAMGFLHVLEGHRGKGYARSVACAFAKDILRRGKIPIAHVDVDNAPSLALTRGLGFREVKRQIWAEAIFL